MSKKKTGAVEPRAENSATLPVSVQNGLGEAIGFGGGGFPNFGGEQISQPTTIFKNLRYFLVSNMRQILSEAYVELGLVQTVVDVPVDDALRGGVEITSKELDEDEIKELVIALERDNDLQTVAQAAKWNRLFGGAGILIIVGDQDPEMPLDLSSIGPDTDVEFRACDMWELYWDQQNLDLLSTSLEKVTRESETFSFYGERVHKSRVMRMKGMVAPSFVRPRLRGWGFSVVEVLVRSINQYLKATDLGFEVLDEFKLDVYKIKNLVNTLLSPNGQSKIAERVRMANWQKNYQNAIVMDSEDDFDHKQLSFAGLAEAMEGIRMQVAADMRIPRSKLFGEAGAGLNSGSNEGDLEVYNSMVESQVRNKIKQDLLKVCEIKCQKLFGMIPDDLAIAFKPLRVLSADQEENVKDKKFQRLMAAKTAGELTTFEFREACNKGGLLDITLDTTQDELNPDDPEIEGVLEGKKDEAEEPGAADDEGKEKDAKEKKPAPKKNSLEYDKAAFEADVTRHEQIERMPFFENPKDKALWATCDRQAREAYGEMPETWQFAVWLYKQKGGRF